MKRNVIICTILLLLFLIVPAFSVELGIKAYKLGGTDETGKYFEFAITDALTGSLNIVKDIDNEDGSSSRGQIDITDYIDDFLGVIPSGKASGSYGNFLFSYRLAGNQEGSYTISMTLPPFKGTATLNTGIVNAYYELKNVNIIFNEAHTTESNDGFTISQTLGNPTYQSTKNSDVSLRTNINVTNGNDTSGEFSNDIWIARGAIFAIIDSSDYEAVGNDLYNASVVVNIQQN